MRPLPPTLLPLLGTSLLASCAIFGGLSEEDQTRLDIYRKNARQYFEEASASDRVREYYRSLDQIDKGLTIVPDDYRLQSQRAWCFLMLGKRDPNVLPEAEKAFKDVMAMRTDADHDPKTILGYGLTLHNLGYIERTRAEILEDEITRRGAGSSDSNDPQARAGEHLARATAYFQSAELQLLKLLEKEDFLALAHRHLMNLKELQGDRAAAKEHGEAFLQECKKQRDHWEKKYQATTVYGYERNVVVPALEELDRNELEVQDALSFMCQHPSYHLR